MSRKLSDAQLAANRANAARSTGPRTAKGKARSAQNARQHGFTATTFAVIRIEELHEVDHLRADLIAHYQPANSQELFAIERMALAQHAMLRASRLEVGLFTHAVDNVIQSDMERLMTPELIGDGDIEITKAQNRNFLLADGFQDMCWKRDKAWTLFLRYQAQAERLYRRALEEFQRARTEAATLPATEETPSPNEPISAPNSLNPQPLPPPPMVPAPLTPDPRPLTPGREAPAQPLPPPETNSAPRSSPPPPIVTAPLTPDPRPLTPGREAPAQPLPPPETNPAPQSSPPPPIVTAPLTPTPDP